MRKLLSNRLYLMLVSVAISFIIWVTVVSISNPDTTGSKVVALEERNASALISADKAYTVLGSKTVKVNYTVQARDAYKVKSSDFRAYIDLSDIYEASGTARVIVQTVANQDIIHDYSAEPQTVQVIVEDIITKTVSVKVYTVDQCPEGYEAAASSTTLTQVDITGPRSLLDSIAVAGVEVSVREATGTLTGTAELKFYDSDDASARAVDVSNNPYFSASEYSTDYTLYINTAKTVPIQYEISGTPAAGYHYGGSTASIGSVIVTGNADTVGQLSVITIPTSLLNVDGATSNKSWNINLNTYLPAGAVISGTYETQITALIEPDGMGRLNGAGGPGVTDPAQTSASESETAADAGTTETSQAAESTGSAAGPGVTTQTQDETESGTHAAQSHDETQSETQSETGEQSDTSAESAAEHGSAQTGQEEAAADDQTSHGTQADATATHLNGQSQERTDAEAQNRSGGQEAQ